MADQIVHREFRALLWVAVGLGITGVALIATSVAIGFPMRGGMVVVAIVALFIAYFAQGVHRMNRITLADDHLQVGRETFTRGELDGLFGVQPPLVLDMDEESRVDSQIPLPPHEAIRVVGGGWGRRLGTQMVLVREAQTQHLLAVFSRRPQELDRRLSAWLGEVPAAPPPDLSGDGDEDPA